jgi:hypothetical protein
MNKLYLFLMTCTLSHLICSTAQAQTGTIFASNCALEAGDQQCTSLIRWTTSNVASPSLVVVGANNIVLRTLSSNTSGMVNYSGIGSTPVTFQLRNGSTVLATKQVAAVSAEAPASIIYLRDRVDFRDTDAAPELQALFNASTPTRVCFDGSRNDGSKGRLRVVGTITVRRSLCLKNVLLVQSMPVPAIITSGDLIESENIEPERILGAADAITYVQDDFASDVEHSQILSFLNTRTLQIITTDPVILENVIVDRGLNTFSGSEGSTGIWIDGANPVILKTVEVKGHGMGKGVLINKASNVTIYDLWIHDLLWSPYPGDLPLDFDRHKSINYNNASIYLYNPTIKKFQRTRLRENIIGLQIMNSHKVDIKKLTVERLGAQFPVVGFVAYQTDGFDLLNTTDFKLHDSSFKHTWEGIDFGYEGAGGVDPAGSLCEVRDVDFEDSFSNGLKFRGAGYTKCNVINSTSTYQGFAGLAIGTPIQEILVHGLKSSNTGYYRLLTNGEIIKPWIDDAGNRTTSNAGVVLSAQNGTAPYIVIEASDSDNSAMSDTGLQQPMAYGFQCDGNCTNAWLFNIDAYNFSIDGAKNFSHQGVPRIVAPVINQQISGGAYNEGNIVRFNANYSGIQTSLKWFFNDKPIANSGPVLYVPANQSTVGRYHYTVSNGAGTVTSASWNLALK